MMKRYHHEPYNGIREHHEGEWVKWEDVKELVDFLNYSLHDDDDNDKWKVIYIRRFLKKTFGDVFIDKWIKVYYAKYKGKV